VKIVSSIFFLPLVFLLFQPVLYSSQTVPKKQCSAKMHCHKREQPSDENNKCGRNGCNPFMACSYGNYYINERDAINYILLESKRVKIVAMNDNRLFSGLSECWHPPEPV
jgi:hypothetical protein